MKHPYKINIVLYCDSDGCVDEAIQWVKDNGHTAETVKILKRDECVVVVYK